MQRTQADIESALARARPRRQMHLPQVQPSVPQQVHVPEQPLVGLSSPLHVLTLGRLQVPALQT